jgi:stage II sporulation protein D
VKGSFRGIEVTQRGVSPRVVSAQIVGSRGRTTVSGATLRARFGLYDTWAFFTTIGTKVQPADPGDETGDPSTGATPARAAGGVKRRRAVLRGTIRGVKRGATVRVQRRTANGRWTTELRTHVGRRGRYAATIARTGTYRVRVQGMAGPSVKLR